MTIVNWRVGITAACATTATATGIASDATCRTAVALRAAVG